MFTRWQSTTAVGLDPERVTLIQQSAVSAIAELTVFYSMLVSVNVLRHNADNQDRGETIRLR